MGVRVVYSEIGPYLGIDSDRAVELAKQYGARPFTDRYPDTGVSMDWRFQRRFVVWDLQFRDPGKAPCDLGDILINAQTGELLSKDLGCLEKLPK